MTLSGTLQRFIFDLRSSFWNDALLHIRSAESHSLVSEPSWDHQLSPRAIFVSQMATAFFKASSLDDPIKRKLGKVFEQRTFDLKQTNNTHGFFIEGHRDRNLGVDTFQGLISSAGFISCTHYLVMKVHHPYPHSPRVKQGDMLLRKSLRKSHRNT